MAATRNVPVLYNPVCGERAAINAAVTEVNAVQTYFRLIPTLARWLPNDTDERDMVTGDELHALLSRKLPGRYAIAVTQSVVDEDVPVDERHNGSVISVADLASDYAPPPVKIHLMFHFVNALIHLAGDLSNDQIDNWAHSPSVGCAFDDYDNPAGLVRSMVAGSLCLVCEGKLKSMGMPDDALAAVEQILAFVRPAARGRPRTTPRAVFIGHGGSRVWKDVRAFVRHHLKLKVQEFDQDARVGQAHSRRLKEMLDASACAILVMTGEDVRQGASGKTTLHARENVVHEIGLFQGRLGWDRAIVLLERGTTPFSNIHGLKHIPFPRGSFSSAAKRQLERTLRQQGIL